MDNITLKDFSDEELLAELERRKKPKFNPKQISECKATGYDRFEEKEDTR